MHWNVGVWGKVISSYTLPLPVLFQLLSLSSGLYDVQRAVNIRDICAVACRRVQGAVTAPAAAAALDWLLLHGCTSAEGLQGPLWEGRHCVSHGGKSPLLSLPAAMAWHMAKVSGTALQRLTRLVRHAQHCASAGCHVRVAALAIHWT
jgi:hypothetical protein